MGKELEKGIILKGIGGFYYVEAADVVYECKARGIFRKNKIKPLAGDKVMISTSNTSYCAIEKILERKSQLERPPIANIEQLVIVISTCDPKPNLAVIDKMTVEAIRNGIKPVIVISKTDLKDSSFIIDIYKMAGIECISFSSVTEHGKYEVDAMLKKKMSVIAGNSGVGKSTLLNCLYDFLNLETGETSKKLGRGRHTTRQVEFFKLDDKTYIADAPGFSFVDISKNLKSSELENYYPEFKEYLGKCRFTGCSHINTKGCKIIEALENEKINKSRYNNYVNIYNEIKDQENRKYR